MILINLLPHREAARRRQQAALRTSIGAAVLLGLLVAAALHLWASGQISAQTVRNDALRSEIKQLESQIRDIANLQTEITELRARQQAVENLQADRNLPVHLLNDLARLLPEGVYLTSVRQDKDGVAITGVAQSNERVSELLRQLSHASAGLSAPELVEIVSGTTTVSTRDPRRVANFSVRARLQRAGESASGPASPASTARPLGPVPRPG